MKPMISENNSESRTIIRDYILKEFLPGEDPADLTDTTPLITSAIFDSISIMKLVSFLEDRFRITIQSSEAKTKNLNTVDSIVSLVSAKLDTRSEQGLG